MAEASRGVTGSDEEVPTPSGEDPPEEATPVAGDPQAAPGAPTEPTARRRAGKGLIEWGAIVVVALLAAFLIKSFLVQAYSIPSGSMEPTIRPGDRVLVDKLSYDLHAVHTGDIIVFARPAADPDTSIKDLIKRVIGLPGQSLRSGPDGEIYVDGKLLKQPWLHAAYVDGGSSADPPICDPSLNTVDCHGSTLVLPKGMYYVMGDNRDDSDDSRFWGPIPKRLIVGRAFLRIWPLSRITWF